MSPTICRFVPAFAILVLLVCGGPAAGIDRPWRVSLEPVFVDVGGNDPPLVDTDSGTLNLETDSGAGYRLEIQRDRRERWGWGLDFFWFTGSQTIARQTASGSPGSPVSWRIADRAYTSLGPESVLFLERLPDTDMNVWTVDLYALRTLSSANRGAFQLLFGLRNADFDNDTRAVTGIEDLGGTRIDASSNYGRMIGPMVGVSVSRQRGKHEFGLTATQSAVFGDAELSASQSDFVGRFAGEAQEFAQVRTFSREESVAIPITELRTRWSYSVTPRVAFGVGARISAWIDVSIPPGVRPGGSLDRTYEETIVLSGLFATVEARF